MTVRLTDKAVLIKLSDPWDLGESSAWKPLAAAVVAAKADDEGGALLVRLKSPFVYKDVRCEYFVAVPRHENCSVEDLTVGRPLLCAITRIPADRLEAEDPFDLSWWRGGVAGIAEIAAE